MNALESAFESIANTLGGGLLSLLGGLAILLIGYIVARLIAGAVRSLLRRTELDNRIARAMGGESTVELENLASRIVFYVLMVLVIILFLQQLNLGPAAAPLTAMMEGVFGFVPNLLAAGAILLVAWIVATIVRAVVRAGARALKLEQRLNKAGALDDDESVSIGETLGSIAFGLILFLFLPAVLNALNMAGMLVPVQEMLTETLAYLPNVAAAAIIFLLGFFIARIVRQLVTSLAAAAGANRLGARVGLTTTPLATLLGTLVFALILLPVVIQTLDALQVTAISAPAIGMLNGLLSAVPLLFGGALILLVSYFVARLVSNLVTELLTGLGADRLPGLLGINMRGERTLSQLLGYLVLALIMLFALIEAANLLGFSRLSDIIALFVAFASDVLLGVVILGIGLYFANFVRNVAHNAGQSPFVVGLARTAILVLAGAMALRQMGLADDIVNLAFGIMLGALGIAAALAFGLGSREIAGREVERVLEAVRGSETPSE